MRGPGFIIAVLAMLFATPALASCETGAGSGARGVALLVGVSDYRGETSPNRSEYWDDLPNAVRDVDLVCKSLAGAGYRIFMLRNPDWAAMDETIADFHIAAMKAPSAVVYFAGHGFEYAGRQYIVPAKAPLKTSRARLRAEFIPLKSVLDAASSAKDFSLFLMDACRTHDPVVQLTDAAKDDLAEPPGNIGLFTVPTGAVIFSTVAGRPAFDDAPAGSPNSPFASAVADSLAVPGLELNDFYGNLHDEVVRKTQVMQPVGPQYPALYKVASGKFYLVAPPVDRAGRVRTGAVRAHREPEKLVLPPLTRLATTDEPQLIREVLSRYDYYRLQQAAGGGDPVAQYLLGYMYEFGVGAKKDLARARGWLERSAAQGHPAGQLELAYFLDRHDPAETAREGQLYEAAAAQGYAKAQSHLAFKLWNAKGDARDGPRAIDLWKKAAAQGHVYANFALALYVPAERKTAMDRLRALSAAGNPEGDNWLCELYYFANKPGEHPQYCERAALAGYSGARAIYAKMNATGEGVDTSPSQARYWAQLALSQPELKERPQLYTQTEALVSGGDRPQVLAPSGH